MAGDSVMDLQKLTEMLETFPSPDTQPDIPQTFLEIAGYPHLENVASNILEFFFDTQAEHGFETLFLDSLLEAAGLDFSPDDLDVDTVEREAFTRASTRLDLVIGTPALLVGIENKLFHQLNNDFEIYEQHLHAQAYGRKVICILLSLYPTNYVPALGGFIPVTYSAFFDNIRKKMGKFVMEANQRYVPFLFDFMQTLEHLRQEETMTDQEFRAWVAEHHNEIKTLLQEIRQLKGQLRKQVKALQARIDIDKHQDSGIKIITWLHDPKDLSVRRFLVYDFVISEDLKFAIDVIVHPDHWEITITNRQPTSLESVKAFLSQDSSINISRELLPTRIRIGEPLENGADKTVIAACVQSLIDQIVELHKKNHKHSELPTGPTA
jgi:hypothetical protein